MDSTIVPKSLPIDGQVKKDMFTSFCQGILAASFVLNISADNKIFKTPLPYPIGPTTIVNIF